MRGVVSLELTGERQVVDFFSMVRKDHRERYNMVLDFIDKDMSIMDAGCGIGYGTYYLAALTPCNKILGIDISGDAIDYAKKHYSHPKINFLPQDIFTISTNERHDLIVSFEVFEHLSDPLSFLKKLYYLLADDGILIISTPNEEVLAYNKEQFPFHIQHYTGEQFEAILKQAGFYLQIRKTQFDGRVLEGFGGNYNIAICRKYDFIHPKSSIDISRHSVESDILKIWQHKKQLEEHVLLLFREEKYAEFIATVIEEKLPALNKVYFFYIGSAYEKLGDYKRAVDYLELVLETYNEFDHSIRASLYYHFAYCLEKIHPTSKKVSRYYSKCLLINPTHRQARIRLSAITG
jgi:SAM-dependent methyltransferase